MILALLVLAVALSGLAALAAPASAAAHRDPCHPRGDCPSDHASYKWRGMLCVKPTSDTRTSSFKQRVRHGGLTYYCKK